ncbi:ligand-dependent corepressor-like isoform X4 [Anguilla anguilla]|uniref:HTH psq-type domain-containing protein n=1 Tax=Anguilla anguilla TaxID=7936 RepID=A0A9D3RKN5_ANGAN|nr:ligand-dependent corepressor-like isoform X4 [Anguilla anguilla]KAG5831282.1 hypothetical protein ANANG_G00302140 [Anguilla anguilla]
MASLCRRQQCTIERRGFRQELDSWRHKLIHCVGFESILKGLFGPGLVDDLTLFKDCEPEDVSDWSFDESCIFCCLRREKVKEHLTGLSNQALGGGEQTLCSQEQSKINKLEKQAEEFLNAVFCRKEIPSFSDPHIPLVAREIMQRMIRQFASEYTSKSSSSQDSLQPNGTKDQSLPKALSLGLAGPVSAASAQNPVLSKLLMADQDSPLDLTVKKPEVEPCEQDGVLDLSLKKSRATGSLSHRKSQGCPATPMKGRPAAGADRNFQDGDEDGLSDGMRERFGRSTPLKPPLTRSLQITKELLSRNQQQQQQPPMSLSARLLNHIQHPVLSEDGSWRPKFDGLLRLKPSAGFSDLKDLESSASCQKGSTQAKPPKEPGHRHSPPVDLKIPQVRGMDLSGGSHASDIYGYGALTVSPLLENVLSKKVRSILPKHSRRSSTGAVLDPGPDFWGPIDQSTSGHQYVTSDPDGDPSLKQPRKKRGRYRQYNTEILEEAIAMVMDGKMSVSKAQTIYGIPHSTLEYKVKERLGTLKNPPKKKMKPVKAEEPDATAEPQTRTTPVPAEEGASQGESISKDE